MRRRLPGRRRRLWRYVSGRRRGVGLFLLAFLSLICAGYWYLTNDARVQRQVERYLHRLTGMRVRVGAVHFSLFGEIRLSNLTMRADDDSDAPFFETSKVLLEHRPWSLLAGRLEPTKIVCADATVRPVWDHQTGRWNIPFDIRRRALSGGRNSLIPIYLRDVQLEVIERLRGQQFRRPKVTLNASLLPDADGKTYSLVLADEDGTIQARGTIDVETGQIVIPGRLSEAGLDKTLPKQYLDWKKRHKLTFKKPWDVTISVGGPYPTAGVAQAGQLRVDLKGVSMELPPEEGGLRLTGVCGALVFDRDGITIEGLTGQIVDAGGAGFTLSGRYDGYDADSPFRTSLTITDARLPLDRDFAGLRGRRFAALHERMNPAGLVDIETTLSRDEQGQLRIEGGVDLKGISLRLPYWPVRLTGVRGYVALKGRAVELVNVRGRYGSADILMSGWIVGPVDRPGYRIEIIARRMPFTDEARDALPPAMRKIWDDFSPRGRADFAIDVRRDGRMEQPAVSVVIDFDGNASLEYAGFPYRLERVEGKVLASPESVEIRSLIGSAGPMRCRLSGSASRSQGGWGFRISIEATDVPLDGRLSRAIGALSPSVRRAYESYALSGRADITNAVVWRQSRGPINCDIPVAIKDASIKHDRFPYSVRRVGGEVRITRQETGPPTAMRRDLETSVAIQHLVGRHGPANINIDGVVRIRNDRQDVDLTVEASDLLLDSELSDALPPDARRGWDLLAPSGTADVVMRLRSGDKAGDKTGPTTGPNATAPGISAMDYRLVVSPRDMWIRYRHFPYTLRCLKGTAVIEPGKVTLKSLTGLAGREGSASRDARRPEAGGKVVLDGRISTRRGSERADVTVRTDMIALDEEMIKAMPAGLVRVLRLRPGGKVELALKKLRIRRLAGTATQPAGSLAWEWEGRITFDRAVTDVGAPGKRLSGWIEGKMSSDGPPDRLAVDANVTLEDVVIGMRSLKSITGYLRKTAASPVLRIEEISGKVFGGQVAGFAQVRLDGPIRYGLNLTVEELNLAEFLKADANDPKRGRDVQGLLAGNVQMTATAGDGASRRATGRLHISKAKLYKLPILLGFLNVINLTLPGDSAFHSGDVDYYVRGDTLVFREIHLQGSALSMLGAGTMDLKTEKLNLTFLTGPPRKLPRLSALNEMLAGIASQIMTVRVTGTLAKPRIQTTALRSLDATMRELSQPGM